MGRGDPMAFREVYGVLLHEMGDLPVITWQEYDKDAGPWFTTRLNLLKMYKLSKQLFNGSRFSMPPAFNDGCGEFLVRAAQLTNANIVGLVFTNVTHKSVGYEYVFEKREHGVTSHLFSKTRCEFSSYEGRVSIDLPNGESVNFHIQREKPKPGEPPAPLVKPEVTDG